MASVAAVNPAAHEEYLLGRFCSGSSSRKTGSELSITSIAQSRLIPRYAAPYAGLAHAWWMAGVFGRPHSA